ncbi:MAG TPA: hypothetical protein VGL21_10265 [Jatrophihabitantaceae bacterium]|jgi:hypothetical protein
MNRTAIRTLTVSAAVIGAAAALVAGAASASADATGGTSTITVPVATEVAQAQAGIVEIPLSPAQTSYNSVTQSVDETFTVTGGDARISVFVGHLEHSGGLLIVDYKTKKSVQLTNIVFDLINDQISAVPSGGTDPVVFFDARGSHVSQRTGTTDSFSASDLQVDAAGAAYLNGALGTSYFVAGQSAGSYAASWDNADG